MPDRIVSAVIMISCALFGGLIGHYLRGDRIGIVLFLTAGILLGLAILVLLRMWQKTPAERVVGGAVGLTAGAVLAVIIMSGIPSTSRPSPALSATIYGFLIFILGVIGMQIGAKAAKEMGKRSRGEQPDESRIAGILDTSVIIDGRVADVCETGFLAGDLVIPEFVLHELQMIADSSESTKRTRGRRGLDILNKMQKQSYVNIIIDGTDYPSIKEVDQKLIQLAKEKGFAILTNDFNLNKVAEVHSIQVLNINRLANALKPIVLPGETMKVQVIKEGKEAGQGVAYLDDGTMVVIDNGRRYMGRTLEVTVTSVLQTTAGRMIFAAIKT
ncbi:MAG: TRAM domain-containing protein [Deltaproteobacteria bacterium]